MTKTQLLDALSNYGRTTYVSYKQIETAINKLTGMPDRRGIGGWARALYGDKAYFTKPTKGDNRFLKRVSWTKGRYRLMFAAKNPKGVMGKTKLFDKLQATGQTEFRFTDIRKHINELRGYSEKTTIGMWSCGLYNSTNEKDGWFLRPTKGDSRYLVKVSKGLYKFAN